MTATVCLVLYAVCLGGAAALSMIAAWRDRQLALTVSVIGATVAVALLVREVARMPGVDMSKPVRAVMPKK